MSKKVYLSETTSVPQILDLLIVYLIFTPIAIGIGDGSLFKILIGYIGGIVNYCIAVVLVILGGVLGGGHLWFGGSPFTAYLFADIAFVFGTVLILLGIGFSEVMDITKFKEIFKGINK